MRLNVEEIEKNVSYLVETIGKNIPNDPTQLVEHLLELSSLGGLSAELCASAEYLYATNKREPVYQSLRVFTEKADKNLHYLISAVQSAINIKKHDLVNSKFQK